MDIYRNSILLLRLSESVFFPYGQRLTLKKSEVEDQKSTKGEKDATRKRKTKKKQKKKQTLKLYRSKMCVCVRECEFVALDHLITGSVSLLYFLVFLLSFFFTLLFFFSSFRRPTPQTGKKKKDLLS